MIKQAKLGKRYLCIKSVEDLYLKGNIYTSQVDGCITDESGMIDHEWTDEEENKWGEVYEFNLVKNFKELED